MIHRDLKPDNVFLVKAQTGSGLEVKLIDFGLAKGQHAQRLTRAGIVPGTLRFFSPEQAAGDEATERSDQYSVALCLYFCLTRHEPYDQLQGNPLELITAINNGEFPRPGTYRELPESLEAIILRAMHREPAQRFPSMRDLGRALWPFAGAAHRELPSPPALTGQRKKRRNTATIAAMTVASSLGIETRAVGTGAAGTGVRISGRARATRGGGGGAGATSRAAGVGGAGRAVSAGARGG